MLDGSKCEYCSKKTVVFYFKDFLVDLGIICFCMIVTMGLFVRGAQDSYA